MPGWAAEGEWRKGTTALKENMSGESAGEWRKGITALMENMSGEAAGEWRGGHPAALSMVMELFGRGGEGSQVERGSHHTPTIEWISRHVRRAQLELSRRRRAIYVWTESVKQTCQ